MKRNLFVLLCLVLTTACSTVPRKKDIISLQKYEMKNTPLLGRSFANQEVFLGGLSGLNFVEEKGGDHYFYSITDRGPTLSNKKGETTFIVPTHSPTIVLLKAEQKTGELHVQKQIPLKKEDGSSLTGLPNHRGHETPMDVFGLYYSIDPNGIDSEGLVSDDEGGFWVADEYGPSLAQFNSEGKMLKRFIPGQVLPRMYSEIQYNRGFEGIAKVGNKLYGFLQSPLSIELNEKIPFARIAEVDIETLKTTAEYFYPFELGNDKISDAVSLGGNSFLVVEHNGKTGEESQKFIYKIITNGSDEMVKKILISDLNDTEFKNVKKVEGITLINDQTIGLIYDNDFGLSGEIDKATGRFTQKTRPNQLLIIQFKDNLRLLKK